MKDIFKKIGIDPLHYEDIKYNTFIDWVIRNSNTPAECQLCLSDKSLQKYFMNELGSVEIRYLTHLQMFKKPLSGQERLSLYFDYLKRFDCLFPKALKPRVTKKQLSYAYN